MPAFALTAAAGLRAREIDLALRWSADAGAPRSLRLVRRGAGHPEGPDDGDALFDLADLFQDGGAGAPWAATRITRYMLDGPAGGGAQAEIAQYFAGAGDSAPARVTARIPGAPGAPAFDLRPVSRIARGAGADPNFGDVATLTIFTQPPGGAETQAAVAAVATQPRSSGPTTVVQRLDGDAPAQTAPSTGPCVLTWTPAGGGAVAVPFARQEARAVFPAPPQGGSAFGFVVCATANGRPSLPVLIADVSSGAPIVIATAAPHGLADGDRISIAGVAGAATANGDWTVAPVPGDARRFVLVGSSGGGAYAGGGAVYPPILLAMDYSETPDAATQQVDRAVAARDRSSPVGTAQAGYYAAFQTEGGAMARVATASALATAGGGFGQKLFDLLPGVHRQYDDPAAGLGGAWQLRRFLSVFGPALDHARNLGEALPDLRDPELAPAEFLPRLGRCIGWELDRTLPTQRQRADIAFATRIYATLGSAANVQALATRATGWGCEIKEFVHNVFLTNAVEPVRLWQIFESRRANAGSGFGAPAPQADLYPVASEPAETQADPARIDARPAAAVDATGAIWLFWHSNRLGSDWRPGLAYQAGATPSLLAPLSAPGYVYVCARAGVSGATAPKFPKTANASVADGGAVWTCLGKGVARRRLWLLRPGLDATPVRPLADLPDDDWISDETPAAVAQAGAIWLAWASNRSGAKEIWTRAWSGPGMAAGAARQVTRDRSENACPALAAGAGAQPALSLFWEARRPEATRIWTSVSADGASWSAARPVSPGPQDRTPAAAFDAGGQMHLFWSAAAQGGAHIRHAAAQAAGGWQIADVTAPAYGVCDRAPAVALWLGALRLAWASNRFASLWTPATLYAIDDAVVLPGGDGSWLACVAAGRSGAAPPKASGRKGERVADGAAVWLRRGPLAQAPRARMWRLWTADGPGFAAPAAALARLSNDDEPAFAVEAGGALRLLFASQETGARFVSRTFDGAPAPPAPDRAAIARALARQALGQSQDRARYIPDAGDRADGFRAPQCVGIFLAPPDGVGDAQARDAVNRLRDSLRPFRPAGARFVYFVKRAGQSGAPVASDP
jgi:phage tail-like protein